MIQKIDTVMYLFFMTKENKLNVLDELNKGCSMGIDSINYVLEKIENKKLKKILEDQCKTYEKISKEIEKLYSKHSDKEPHETNMMEKMMTWYGIQMRVNDDDNESKIAELFIKGTNMGIIEGRKLLNNKENDKKTKDLIQRYVDFQEEYVEKLKEFL